MVIDPVGDPLLSQALKCVAWGASIVIIGFAGGQIPKVNALAADTAAFIMFISQPLRQHK